MQKRREKISCFVSYLSGVTWFSFFFFSLTDLGQIQWNILSTQLELLKIGWNKAAVLCLCHIPSGHCTFCQNFHDPFNTEQAIFSNQHAHHWNDRMNPALPTSAKSLKKLSLTTGGTTQKGQNHSSIHTSTQSEETAEEKHCMRRTLLAFPHLVQLLITAAPINPWSICSKKAIWNQT